MRSGVAPDHPKLKSVTRIYEKTAAKPGFRFFGGVALGEQISRRGAGGALPRGGLRDRHARRQPPRDPRRGPARLAFRDRVRGLVQRPPRVPRARVRPLRRPRGGDRQRQRGDRRRAHARPGPRGAGADRHGRPCDHRLRRLDRGGGRPARPPRARRRRRSPTPRSASSASWRAPTWSATRRRSRPPPRPPTPTAKRNVELFRDYAQREPSGKSHRIELRFLRSPVEILGEGEDGPVTGVRVAVNRLEEGEDGRVRAVPTGEEEVIECGLVLRSIGYRGRPLDDIPFDERRGLIRNEGGRVCDEDGHAVPRRVRRGLDQARALRRDRHQQEGRRRHGGPDPRGRRGGPARAARRRGSRRVARRAGARRGDVGGLAGDRRGRAPRRGGPGPPAGQARHARRAGRGGAPGSGVR